MTVYDIMQLFIDPDSQHIQIWSDDEGKSFMTEITETYQRAWTMRKYRVLITFTLITRALFV